MIDLRNYFNIQSYRPIPFWDVNVAQPAVWGRVVRPTYRVAKHLLIRLALLLRISPNLFYKRSLSNYTYLATRLRNRAEISLLEKIAAIRTIGGRFVRFEEVDAVFLRLEKELGIKRWYGGKTEMAVDLASVLDLPDRVKINAEPFTIATLACGQYQHPFASPVPGDVCVDFGAYEGETSLFMAAKVGPSGRVYAAEFVPEQLRILNDNLRDNPVLGERVRVLPHPFWSESGKEIFVTGTAGTAKVSFARHSATDNCFRTIRLDDAVQQYKINKIDFLKFDVEGAELPILKGAVKTLKEFKPKLAVSLYHCDSDFDAIPRFLDSLQCGYEFHLGHYSTGRSETVLYAAVLKEGQ